MTISLILTALVYIVIVFIVIAFALYVLRQVALTPELHRLADIALYAIAVVLVVLILLGLVRGTLPTVAMHVQPLLLMA